MKVIYVAGPFLGRTPTEKEMNLMVARRIGLACARKGWSPLIPHANTWSFELCDVGTEYDHQFWYDATMELLRRCDAVVVASDFGESAGTICEIKEAKRLGLEVFVNIDMVPSV